MKVRLILDAIEALVEARKILRVGGVPIPEQIAAGDRCCDAHCALRVALENQFPDIDITEEA